MNNPAGKRFKIESMTKNAFLFLFLTALSCCFTFGQQAEKIEIPKGIVYNYCDPKTFENSKDIIRQSLTEKDNYSLVSDILIIGPVLWSRFEKIELIKNIKGGNTTLLVDSKKLSAKLTQNIEDSKKVWDELRKEIDGKTFTLRKANPKELRYYWTVIAFDIDEPLVIIETGEGRYIVNINPKTMKLLWLDQAP